MKRRALMKRLREIANGKGVEMTTREGGQHTVILFAGQRVTTVPRHTDINEYTARGCVNAAEGFTKGPER